MIDLERVHRPKVPPAGAVQKPSLLNREIRLFPWKMNDKRKERFYNEFNVLLTAGLDIRSSLDLLHSEAQKNEERQLYGKLLASLDGGSSLADSIRASGYFSGYEYYCLRIGEETGTMSSILSDLSSFYKKKIKQKRKLGSALSYPAIVIVIALLAVVFMLQFVVPMFADMLSRFHTELPELTKIIISASGFLGAYSVHVLCITAALFTILWLQRKKEAYRRVTSHIVLRIPLAGRLTRKIYLERFAHAMQLLLSAQTNLVGALDLVRKMVGYYPLEEALGTLRHDIISGKSLHSSMSRHTIFPTRLVSLIRVAEESNQLDKMFGRISSQLSDEIEHETSLLSSFIEPFMILFLGMMVAVILVAMYLPMFKLGTAFG